MSALAERFRVPRTREALPEYTNTYRDDGCDVAPKCLSCPLPACRYDIDPDLVRAELNRARALLAAERAATARAMSAEGRSPHEIATALGISLRTVYRYLGEVRP